MEVHVSSTTHCRLDSVFSAPLFLNAQNMYATPCRIWSSIASITTNLETCKHALKQRAYFIEFALNIISLYHYDHGVSDQARILRKTARTCRGASTAGWRRRRAGCAGRGTMATDFGSVQILALESFKFLGPRSFFFMPGPKNFLWPFTRAQSRRVAADLHALLQHRGRRL